MNGWRFVFSRHAIERMFERSISKDEVLAAIEYGEVIEEYPNDSPFPSVVKLARVGDRFLHVVIAEDAKKHMVYVITVYDPDPALWDEQLKKRRPR